MSFFPFRRSTLPLVLSALLVATSSAQTDNKAASHAPAAAAGAPPLPYLAGFAQPLAKDRGAAGLSESLRRLATRASLMMVTAHPDDEDGGMLAFHSRGRGVDTTLLTLNRGEGGQNVMSSDFWDQLGVLRTQELLAAGDHYGVHQYFTRVTDYGFSKTIEEALKTWGHDRVLYDCVRVVRLTRPLVVSSVFAGYVSDGHGHHQTAGLMAQEVYKMAGDPNVFPDQIKAGLLPWSPLKVYARVPFARVTDKGIYDYATGKWAPVRFRNYVDGTSIEGIPSTTVEIPEGEYNPLLANSYLATAREGLAQQRSQNGGIGVPPARPFVSPYHLYASRVTPTVPAHEATMFDGIDISLPGIATYAPAGQGKPWHDRLQQLSATVEEATAAFNAADPSKSAPALARGLAEVNKLLADLAASKLPADARYNMAHELEVKQAQFNQALNQALGVSVLASVLNGRDAGRFGPFGDMSNQAGTFQTVVPGQTFRLNLHIANQGPQPVVIKRADMVSHAGPAWRITPENPVIPEKAGDKAAADKPVPPITGDLKGGDARDQLLAAVVPQDAALTRPYYSRPSLEQSFYDILDPQYLSLPTTPYPLSAEITYTYAGVDVHLSGVVQTIHRFTGPGPLPEPLLVAPAISLTVSPEAGVVPLANASLQLQVKVRSSVKGPARGQIRLELPSGWTCSPATEPFATTNDGDERILSFQVMPKSVQAKPYTITAVADYNGQQFRQGFENTGYVGLRPYPYFRPSTYRTTGVDVKVAPDLRVGYIMGTGDDIPRSLEDLGVHVASLSPTDIATADLSVYDAVILGIRAYAARPELRTSNSRLLSYAQGGGTVIVQYQTPEFDHGYGPYPLTLTSDPEKVVEEDCKVTLTAPNDPILSWPNRITEADFNGWVEERGHGFMKSWDPHYIAPTEMHDAGQDLQKGGLLYAHTGKGAYVYMAYAFFREMPDGVPGAFRIMSNLISLGKNPAFKSAVSTPPLPQPE